MSQSKLINKVFFMYFSEAIQYFYGSDVETIVSFEYTKVGLQGPGYKSCFIEFNAPEPGNAKLLSVSGNQTLFEINMLVDDLILELFWYEFEIIRPFVVTSMMDLVNRYRFLLNILAKYQSGEFMLKSDVFYLKFLKNILPLLQNSIEVIAVNLIDNKQLKSSGGVEGLIVVDFEDRLPFTRDVKSVNEQLVKSILFN